MIRLVLTISTNCFNYNPTSVMYRFLVIYRCSDTTITMIDVFVDGEER